MRKLTLVYGSSRSISTEFPLRLSVITGAFIDYIIFTYWLAANQTLCVE